jgi:hypothetical protein
MAFPWGDEPSLAAMFPAVPAATVPNPNGDWENESLGIPVGSHPAAASRFGHHDLIGGLREHVRDNFYWADQEMFINLNDDAWVPDTLVGTDRMNRLTFGPAWDSLHAPATAPWDEPWAWNGNPGSVEGIRCARDPKE